MTKGILIALFGDQDPGLDLTGADVHFPCPEVEVPDGCPAHSLRTRQLNDGVIGEERRGRVGRGHTVAGVAADGADVADLRAAHLVHRLSQHPEVLLDQRVPGNVREAGERADADGTVLLHLHAPEFIQTVNGDQLLAGPLSLPHLHQHVGAAGDDLGLGMGQAEGHGICHIPGLIQCFHIIHAWSLLNLQSARPL